MANLAFRIQIFLASIYFVKLSPETGASVGQVEHAVFDDHLALLWLNKLAHNGEETTDVGQLLGLFLKLFIAERVLQEIVVFEGQLVFFNKQFLERVFDVQLFFAELFLELFFLLLINLK